MVTVIVMVGMAAVTVVGVVVGGVVMVGAIVSRPRGVQGQGRGAGIHEGRVIARRWRSAVNRIDNDKVNRDIRKYMCCVVLCCDVHKRCMC